ncbi:hypothetical protein HPB51_005401 [Rhipicephalus microplus]|uniref:PiggyBac transposable element-derived protein domain-containing protein n=1 Tax=Rhipicephalus microplus TaxID=6941 RepID=A0A9J6EMH8_RHIMP|nr:hypothetical protein HPB51_005401 [Rhipicephalus microplus]
MYSFEGEYRKRPQQSLGGASKKVGLDDLLRKSALRRQNREESRRQEEAALKIKAYGRGFLSRRRLARELRQKFDTTSRVSSDLGPLLSSIPLFYDVQVDTERLAWLSHQVLLRKDEVAGQADDPVWRLRIRRLLALNVVRVARVVLRGILGGSLNPSPGISLPAEARLSNGNCAASPGGTGLNRGISTAPSGAACRRRSELPSCVHGCSFCGSIWHAGATCLSTCANSWNHGYQIQAQRKKACLSTTTDSLCHPEVPFTCRIVLHLLEKVEQATPGSGYHLYTDKFYTSPMLAEELLSHSILLTGTVMTNRKQMPQQLKKKMKKGEVTAYRRGKSYMALAWRDKRQVTMLSSAHNASTKEVPRKIAGGKTLTLKKPVVVRVVLPELATRWPYPGEPLLRAVLSLEPSPWLFQALLRLSSPAEPLFIAAAAHLSPCLTHKTLFEGRG